MVNTLILNNKMYRYSIQSNSRTEQYAVFLLGALQDIESVNSFSSRFAENLNCVTIEVPGTGRTPTLDAKTSIREQSEMLLELIKHLNIKKAHLMAFSYATAITVELCAIWGGVSSMTICGGVPGIPASGRDATKRMIADAVISKDKFADTFINSLTVSNPDIPRGRAITKAMKKSISNLDDERINTFFENSLRLLVHEPANVNNINVPCAVLVGEYDPYVTPLVAREFSEKLSNCFFVEIKNADHLVHLQQPEKTANIMSILSKSAVDTEKLFHQESSNILN